METPAFGGFWGRLMACCWGTKMSYSLFVQSPDVSMENIQVDHVSVVFLGKEGGDKLGNKSEQEG